MRTQCRGGMTVAEASGLLQLSTRQVKRLKASHTPEQVDCVGHGNRGRVKPWAIAEAVKKRIVELARSKYTGFNDSHLTEKLVEVEKIEASRETVRRILAQALPWWQHSLSVGGKMLVRHLQ